MRQLRQQLLLAMMVLMTMAGSLAVGTTAAAAQELCTSEIYSDAATAKANFADDCGTPFQETNDYRCDWVPGGWQCTGPGNSSAGGQNEPAPEPEPAQPSEPEPTPSQDPPESNSASGNCTGGIYANTDTAKAKFTDDCGAPFRQTNDYRCDWVPGGWQCTGPGNSTGGSTDETPETTAAKPGTPAMAQVVKRERYVSVVWRPRSGTKGVNVYRNGQFVSSVNAPGTVYNDYGGRTGDRYHLIAYSDQGTFSDESRQFGATQPFTNSTSVSGACRNLDGNAAITNVQLSTDANGTLRVGWIGDCGAARHKIVLSDGKKIWTRYMQGRHGKTSFTIEPFTGYTLTTSSGFSGSADVRGETVTFAAGPMTFGTARNASKSASPGGQVVWSSNDVVSTHENLESEGWGVVLGAAGFVGSTFTRPEVVGIALVSFANDISNYNQASSDFLDALDDFDKQTGEFLLSEGLPALPPAGAYGYNEIYPEVEAWIDFRRELPYRIAEEFGRRIPTSWELGRFIDGLVRAHKDMWGQPIPRNPNNPVPYVPSCQGCQNNDQDRDGVPDLIDYDLDGDGIPNSIDRYPDTPYEGDLDGDGIGNSIDGDRDGDGIPNNIDRYPDLAVHPGGGGDGETETTTPPITEHDCDSSGQCHGP